MIAIFVCVIYLITTKKTKEGIQYPSLSSAVKPVPHGPDIPIPTQPLSQAEISSPSYAEDEDIHFSSDRESKNVQPLDQSELNDLVRDLGFTKEKSELLGSTLKQKNLLAPGTTFYWYRNHEEEIKKFFIREGELVYCCNIPGLIHRLGGAYEPDDWCLSSDSSKSSLKAVLLNNENNLASVPVANSSSLKESYENLQMVLENIKYNEHKWHVCCDLKACGILLANKEATLNFRVS
jgi:hypothetical protein